MDSLQKTINKTTKLLNPSRSRPSSNKKPVKVVPVLVKTPASILLQTIDAQTDKQPYKPSKTKRQVQSRPISAPKKNSFDPHPRKNSNSNTNHNKKTVSKHPSGKNLVLKKRAISTAQSKSNSLQSSMHRRGAATLKGSKQSNAIDTIESIQAGGSKAQAIKLKKQELRPAYQDIVERMFKRIDFFDKNSLEPANINRWISQTVLYFFGPILHKVRQGIKMSRAQFIKETEAVFDSSSYQDISNFVKSAYPCPGTTPDSATLTRYYQSKKHQNYKPRTANPSPRAALNQSSRNNIQLTLAQSGGIWDMPLRRNPQKLKISRHLEFEEIEASSQAETPLFSDGSKALGQNINFLNKTLDRASQGVTQAHKHKILFKDMDLKHSFNYAENSGSKPDESKVEKRIRLDASRQATTSFRLNSHNSAKENEQRADLQWRRLENEASEQEKRISQLKDKLDYFIKRNNEHLELSKNVRLQNGF